jgi:hypothetical protein
MIAQVLPDGDISPLVVFVAASLLFVLGMMLWALRNMTRERLRLLCPVRLRSARVLFKLAPNALRTDVLRCSVFGRQPITCGKVCLHSNAHRT